MCIRDREEMEAWMEMSKFYGDQFEIIILEIQQKFINNENLQNFEEDSKEHRLELLEKNKYPHHYLFSSSRNTLRMGLNHH